MYVLCSTACTSLRAASAVSPDEISQQQTVMFFSFSSAMSFVIVFLPFLLPCPLSPHILLYLPHVVLIQTLHWGRGTATCRARREAGQAHRIQDASCLRRGDSATMGPFRGSKRRTGYRHPGMHLVP